jgi:hypothetical protein
MRQVGAGEHIPTITFPFPIAHHALERTGPYVTGVTIANFGIRRNIDQLWRTPYMRSSQNSSSTTFMNKDKKRGSRGVVPRSDSGVSQPHPSYVRAGYA